MVFLQDAFGRFLSARFLKAPVLAALLLLGLSAQQAYAYEYATLHAFCAKLGCRDGAAPWPGVIMDKAGNLYGATVKGGTSGNGLVFELMRNASTGKWFEKVLYEFCTVQTDCPDGSGPNGLVMDSAGTIYGTTWGGGRPGKGVIFRLRYDAGTGKWKEDVLYTFCAGKSRCTDGANPNATLLLDSAGNLYGTTVFGGNVAACLATTGSEACGVVFELSPNTATGKWSQEVLHAFCSEQNCADGFEPFAELVMDKAGNLFGTTEFGSYYCDEFGCDHGPGVIFELTPGAPAGTWTEKVIHSFNYADGANPVSSLTFDPAGNLFGTTLWGGRAKNASGTVFELTFDAVADKWNHKIIHNFCAQCAGGAEPQGKLVFDAAGNLFGTTYGGGTQNCSFTGGYNPGCGTVFQLTPPSDANPKWAFHLLKRFCGQVGCPEGSHPADLLIDKNSNLYGANWSEGHGTNSGAVFELRKN